MDVSPEQAAATFAQLGNETRLGIVRLLVRAADTGLSVGEVQRALAIPASTLSHHLQHLRGAGLLEQQREGNVLRCRVNMALLHALAGYLVTECCAGVSLSRDEHAA